MVCGTLRARGSPSPPYRRAPNGIATAGEGGGAATVVRANAVILTVCALPKPHTHAVGSSQSSHQCSEGTQSRFAIEGKSELSDTSTHHDLARLAATRALTESTSTSNAHSERLFSEKICIHLPGKNNSIIVGKATDGETYKTESAQAYPVGMNAALAKGLLKLMVPSAAVLLDAGGGRGREREHSR
eukprot:3329511-Pleurochrysis_carterae.AAC.1